MSAPDPTSLKAVFDELSIVRHIGRVCGVSSGLVQITGLADKARIGDRLELKRSSGRAVSGEVLRVENEQLEMLPESVPEGVSIGDRVVLHRVPSFAPGLHWLGRVVDPFGQPMDGRPLLRGKEARNIRETPPPAVERKPMGDRLPTGLAVLNTILPIVRGQRIGLFAGSGVGKSSLMSQLAKSMKADAIVVALIGERGREVNEFVEKTLGPEGMSRAIVVAATSDQSALVRRRCAWAAMSVAETLRDEGLDVLFLADSITRFAEAHREISAAMGEAPALRGFPPSVTPLITSLCERAGPGTATQGDITAVFSVLVAGSDMDEPVADILRGVLDGHLVLDRDIAERGRFPAIDVSRSVSRCLPDAANAEQNELIGEVRRLLGSYEQSEVMIKAGLYAEGTDPLLDKAVRVWPDLDSFFAKTDSGGIDSSFSKLKLIMRRATPGQRG